MSEQRNVRIPDGMGILKQKQDDYRLLRVKAAAGDLTAAQLSVIAAVAERYGNGVVHLSTRQGIEIHHIHKEVAEEARAVLLEAGVEPGASGDRVRVIVACPGNATCRWGVIETKAMARELDRRFFGEPTPYKFKIAVSGCANNCTRASDHDAGIRGAVEPGWLPEPCTDCRVCVRFCPVGAITRQENVAVSDLRPSVIYNVDYERCINCSICTTQCPTKAWVPLRQGYTLFIGGTVGKKPRAGTLLRRMIQDEEEVYRLVAEALESFKRHGRKKERFGHMIDRLNQEQAMLENVKNK